MATTQAQILIIGAGIVGSSTAYYLTQYGLKDVLVIDKGELFENDGSTSHAPGGVNPISQNTAMVQFAAEAINLYESLDLWKPERKPLHMVGGIDIARTPERIHEIERNFTNMKSYGVDSRMIRPDEIEAMVPFINAKPFVGGLFTQRKPIAAGAHLCGSMARVAEQTAGTRFVGHTKAIDFIIAGDRIRGVKTHNPEMPEIRAEKVLLCTNIWTPALTEKLGISIPLLSAEHQYVRTEALAALNHVSDRADREQEIIYPSVRDLDMGLYYRHWWDQIGIGSYHHKPIMIQSRTLGERAEHPFTPDDFEQAHRIAKEVIPAIRDAKLVDKFNGMFSFSVDGMPIIGETSLKGFWVATAVWLTHGGGAGMAAAQLLAHGHSEIDLRDVSIDRFLPHQHTRQFIQVACEKSYAEVHDVIHPAQWPSKPRDIRFTPFYERHKDLGAVFTPAAGIEMPYWLEENQRLLEDYDEQIPERSGWGAQYWSRIQGAEHLAMRESAGLFDLSSLAIIEVNGRDAQTYMDYVCTNRMSIAVGRVTYTLLCTPSGGIKRDVTVSRLAEDRYWIFTGNATVLQEMRWLEQFIDGYDVHLTDHSQHYAALGLFGPNARKVLDQITPNDVSNEAFPFYTWQMIEVGMTPVYAMRISYVGELGWELHLPMDVALGVRDRIWAAGQEVNLVACGVGAMRSMRLEKGYRLRGGDIFTEHNPYEAGMGWLVKLKKGDFVGREALVKLRQEAPQRKLVTLTLDEPNTVLTGNEPLFSNGSRVGMVTSGNYGYSVGKYVAFGYVGSEYAQPGTALQVEYMTERFAVQVAEDALYDPINEKMWA